MQCDILSDGNTYRPENWLILDAYLPCCISDSRQILRANMLQTCSYFVLAVALWGNEGKGVKPGLMWNRKKGRASGGEI